MIASRRMTVAAITTAIVIAGCQGRARVPQAPSADPAVKTIEQASDVPAIPLPSEQSSSATSSAAPALVDLPFTPAISMDPVDGGKVSIRPDTPVAEFKDRIYYFRSDENRQAFLRNPEKYARGSLSRY